MRALSGIALAAALVACRSPTQISVDVSTNVACGSWQGAAVAVGELGPSLETKPAATTTTYCNDAGYIGTVVAIPSGAENANVAFRVVGAVGQTLEQCTVDASTGCIVARRALNFIPHESLSLAVPLLSSCEGILCDPSSTCVQGTCRPATIPDPSQCASQTCGEGALGAADGGSADGAVDATMGEGGTSDGGPADATLADAETADAGSDAPAPPSEAGTFDASYAGCGIRCALSLGEETTCVVREGGVTCWGQNYNGETGNPLGLEPAPPAPVLSAGGGNLTGVRGVVTGESTSCAYLTDGGVACWGGGSPLGSVSDTLVATPQAQFAGSPQLSIGNYHMCWVTLGRQIVCQAEEASGIEPAAFDNDGGSAPVTLAPPVGYIAPFPVLDTTRYFTCVLTPDGAVYCLGDNGYGYESDPNGGGGNTTTFTRVQPLAPALELALMAGTGCVRTAGHVFCWGTDDADETGSSITGISEVRFADGGPLANAVQLAPGTFNHACARLADGHVACWGNNQQNQLGRGGPAAADGGFTNLAALVVDGDGGAFANVALVAGGGYHTCALKTDGSLWCWGDNSYGQLGQDAGDTATRSVPTYVNQ